MWQRLPESGKQVIALTARSQQHETEIRELREELRDVRQELQALIQAVRELRLEQQQDRDVAARDREDLTLRRENCLLRHERGLPPGMQGPVQTRWHRPSAAQPSQG